MLSFLLSVIVYIYTCELSITADILMYCLHIYSFEDTFLHIWIYLHNTEACQHNNTLTKYPRKSTQQLIQTNQNDKRIETLKSSKV